MLAAVKFNDEGAFPAGEIDNEGINRHLPPEFMTIEPAIA
jgi:hypothetical protein